MICTANPFLRAMKENIIDLINSSDVWLNNINKHIHEAIDAKYTNYDHERFFPFDPMGHCSELSCIGGECSSDTKQRRLEVFHSSRILKNV